MARRNIAFAALNMLSSRRLCRREWHDELSIWRLRPVAGCRVILGIWATINHRREFGARGRIEKYLSVDVCIFIFIIMVKEPKDFSSVDNLTVTCAGIIHTNHGLRAHPFKVAGPCSGLGLRGGIEAQLATASSSGGSRGYSAQHCF